MFNVGSPSTGDIRDPPRSATALWVGAASPPVAQGRAPGKQACEGFTSDIMLKWRYMRTEFGYKELYAIMEEERLVVKMISQTILSLTIYGELT